MTNGCIIVVSSVELFSFSLLISPEQIDTLEHVMGYQAISAHCTKCTFIINHGVKVLRTANGIHYHLDTTSGEGATTAAVVVTEAAAAGVATAGGDGGATVNQAGF